MNIKNVKAQLSKYIDVDYFVRFILLLTALYYFNVFYIAIVDKKGLIYSSFLDNYLNYISCVRYFVLYTTNSIVHLLGVNSAIYFPDFIRTINRCWVKIEPGCLALNLVVFWVAFVMANKEPIKRKIFWSIAGVIGISIINCWRIALILLSFEFHWKAATFSVYHAKFNFLAYSLIAVMIYFYTKTEKKQLKKVVV